MRQTLRALQTLLLTTLLCTSARAQIGLHPPEVDWQQIVTDEGNVIYPKGYEVRAQRVANLMHAVYENHRQTVGDKLYEFDLVLQTPNTTINGYVGLAPFRSEFFLTPPQQPNLLSNTDWVDLLTIHEFRHVQQFSNERRGLTMLWSVLFGQPGWALGGLGTPNWYSEGDAVVMETALTHAGRARTPAFSAGLRALLDEDIVYSYRRARNNSLKRFIPDHYRYGYNTIAYGREQFGAEAWTKALQKSGAWSGLLYAFSNRLKKETGLGTKKMYRAATEDLRARQERDLAERGPFVEGLPVESALKAVTNYTYPQVDDRGRLLALRSGYQHTPHLVEIDRKAGKEQEIIPIGIQRESYVHVRGGSVTWMENRNDPRYTNQGYSDVFVYDFAEEKKVRLSTNQKYFSPSLSFDESKIVAVEENELTGVLQLVVLEVADQEGVIATIPIDANSAALPKFSLDGQTIYYYEKTFAGTAIVAVVPTPAAIGGAVAGARKVVKEPSFEPLGNLDVSAGGKIIYTSGRDGIDNVYSLDPATGAVDQLTNVRIGAEYASVTANDELYYTESTSRGMHLRYLEKVMAQTPRPAGPNVYERPAALEEEVFDLTDNVPERAYESQDIHDNLSGIRLHTWSFAGSALEPGIGLIASNALNTTVLAATGTYNFNEERPRFALSAAYGGAYPVLSVGLGYAERNFVTSDLTDGLALVLNNLSQVELNVNASVPYNWTAGEYSFAVIPAVGLTGYVLSDESRTSLPNSFVGGQTTIAAQVLKRRARQQVHSRLGATVSTDFRRTLSGDNLGQALQFFSRLWLPGIGRTHGVRLDFAYRSESSERPYQYVDNFQYARGYDVDFVDNAYRVSANYEFPLLHPDIGLLGIWYLQRIRLNAFIDHGAYNLVLFEPQNMTSAGGEIYFDQVWLNAGSGSLGFQWAHILADTDIQGNRSGDTVFQFIIGQRF
ncbi:TolB family protein [Neolewinella antarctica]|uniref:Bacterial surface antigen (D15) domain-containing protein n=1 Tax=Neolewinella antarctica TaxID=442734 RepID=A0ABX0XB22_9BACT|nr:hypothetical protein [Neolewinella antarctica]NJC26028.1 hypothetical protein [Neolewinella antarctica]